MTMDGTALALDSAQLISAMFSLLPVPVAVLDDLGRVLLSNSTFSEIFQGVGNLPASPQCEVEVNGRSFQVQRLPLNDHGFEFVFATDVSDIAQLRKQITHLEKMAAVGRVLTGVAHELGTPLADIASHAVLVDRSNLTPEVQDMVGSMLSQAERATCLVQNLLALAGITAPKRVAVDLNAIVRDAVERRGRPQPTGQFDVTLDLDANLPKAAGDPSQIEQVVLEVLLHAESSIATAQDRPGSIQIRTCVRTGRIQLHVCDNGYGRDAACVFETRDKGVGLNICAEIVKDHGGELYAWSSYGGGSTLTLELPVYLQDSEAGGSVGRLRGKDVIVVDDEVHITEFVCDVLQRQGARVQVANSGSEAYEKIRSKHFDLIVCDQHMPGLSGQSLYRLVENGDSSAPNRFLFITGDVVHSEGSRFSAQNGVTFLRKPFRTKELLETIDHLFNRNLQPGF